MVGVLDGVRVNVTLGVAVALGTSVGSAVSVAVGVGVPGGASPLPPHAASPALTTQATTNRDAALTTAFRGMGGCALGGKGMLRNFRFVAGGRGRAAARSPTPRRRHGCRGRRPGTRRRRS